MGRLRGLLGGTLNDLTERMSTQAEQLESYRRAIALQEKRLADLHDVEQAADALAKLTRAYEERSHAAEEAYQARLAELETSCERRSEELEASYRERKTAIDEETTKARAVWEEEKTREKKARDEAAAALKKEREREQAEYCYERDRSRKLEEHAYEERREALEKELQVLKESTLKQIAEREAAVQAKEGALEALRAEAKAFPEQLQSEVEKTRRETAAAVKKEWEQKAQLAAMERAWEGKMAAQRIEHLEALIAAQEQKLEQLRTELAGAQVQVNEIAKKAIEGASLTKAFQSVNQIALEQARKPEVKGAE